MAERRGRIRIEPGRKRIRTYLGGELVADTTHPLMVWEKPYYPTYYFPAGDVRTDLLVETGEQHRSPSRGTAPLFTVKTSRGEAIEAARWYRASEIPELVDHLTFRWDAMDAWFEEDEEVYVHARDPYTRVDILQSSRHIRVVVDGVAVADSVRPRLLFETGLPTRYYLPKTDVRLDLLIPSETKTHCPYKGTASYYHIDVGGNRYEDHVWWYPTPVRESADIAGFVSFYNEKLDIYVDGELEERPKTVFS